LRPNANTPVFQTKLDRVEQLLKANGDAGLEAVIDQLGKGIKASESVPTAIYAFLRRPSSFSEVVTYAISLGGDTDTIACMAGAFAGAHLGLDGIPALWAEGVEAAAEGVEAAAELLDLADSLLSLSSAGRFWPSGEGGLAR
jgi:poly(ADP-ribose) glycohydrolase ARH3